MVQTRIGTHERRIKNCTSSENSVMVKRSVPEVVAGSVLPSPGLAAAPVLDLMCSHFVLTLVAQQGTRFNVRRDLHGLLALTGRHLVWPQPVLARLREFLAWRCKDNELWRGHEALSPRQFLDRHGNWNGPYEEGTLFFYLDDYAKDAPKDLLAILSATGPWLRLSLKKHATLVEKNIAALSGLLQLNQAERALLLYGTLARYQRDLRSMLVEFKVSNAPEAYAAIAEVAGVNPAEVGEALRAGSRLERIGLVDNLISEHNITDLADLMKVSEKLPPVLMREYRNPSELMAVFTRPAAHSLLTPTDFAYIADDVAVLVALLRQAIHSKAEGVNVLLYGPPGTGKTELARVLAQTAGAELFEVESADRDGNSLSGRDRYRSLQIAQVFLKGAQRAALLFDEVEDVFPSVDAASHSVNGKAWVNQILETNPVPTVWITNRIEHIDPAFRRRFTYHLQLNSPPPGAREQLLRKTLEGVDVSDAFVAQLSARPGLTPAQIRTAARFATLAHDALTRPDGDGCITVAAPLAFETLIERQLHHADAALGRATSAHAVRPAVTRYDLSLLNLDSRHDITRIIAALQVRSHGTLCFDGPPGTGKTALAEHMAQALGRPLMVKQASDVLGKYVGETEQALAAMFRAAEAEQAVLLLDEADSLLQDRRGAQRRHEVSAVNELLQGMERFRGIFICTTNLFEQLDAAALRRFSFKIRFKPLNATQREAMYTAEALGGDAAQLTPAARARLACLTQLCPGDFATVQRQAQILASPWSPEEFLEQLEAEHRLKPEVREARGMGFVL